MRELVPTKTVLSLLENVAKEAPKQYGEFYGVMSFAGRVGGRPALSSGKLSLLVVPHFAACLSSTGRSLLAPVGTSCTQIRDVHFRGRRGGHE